MVREQMSLFPKKVKKVTKHRQKPKMNLLNIKKVKSSQKKETKAFRLTTLKHCDFHLTYREKYEQEMLEAKRKKKERAKKLQEHMRKIQ